MLCMTKILSILIATSKMACQLGDRRWSLYLPQRFAHKIIVWILLDYTNNIHFEHNFDFILSNKISLSVIFSKLKHYPISFTYEG